MGIDVTAYASVDVDVAGQAASGVKYIWTDQDGEGAWDVSGYQYCAVDGAAVPDYVARLWIEVDDNEEFSISLWNYTAYNSADAEKKKAKIFWGDGNYTQMQDAVYRPIEYIEYTHVYSEKGKYVIEIIASDPQTAYPIANSYCLGQSSSAPNTSVKYIEAASSFSFSSDGYAFAYCSELKKIRLMRYSNLPSSGARTKEYVFRYCSSLETLEFFDVPVEGWPFTYVNRSLESYAFADCAKLKNIICTNKSSLFFDRTYTRTFYNCILINDTSFLLDTGITKIGWGTFDGCSGLEYIYIPDTVTDIDNNAFLNCVGAIEVHFLPTTPPTVANANAWSGIPTTCTIYVPTGTLSAYTSAANYPDPATYTYIEE